MNEITLRSLDTFAKLNEWNIYVSKNKYLVHQSKCRHCDSYFRYRAHPKLNIFQRFFFVFGSVIWFSLFWININCWHTFDFTVFSRWCFQNRSANKLFTIVTVRMQLISTNCCYSFSRSKVDSLVLNDYSICMNECACQRVRAIAKEREA